MALIQRQLQCILVVIAVLFSLKRSHTVKLRCMCLSMTLIGEVPSDEHLSKCSGIVLVIREGITIHVFFFFFVCF